jgi:hypothetical protein
MPNGMGCVAVRAAVLEATCKFPRSHAAAVGERPGDPKA